MIYERQRTSGILPSRETRDFPSKMHFISSHLLLWKNLWMVLLPSSHVFR